MNPENFFNWFWWILGFLLIILEFILPGLVVVFVGLGAITVAILKYWGIVDDIITQFLIWFISSIIYCFTLRILVVKMYPSDKKFHNIDEDNNIIGQAATVMNVSDNKGNFRIKHSYSTWNARTKDGCEVKEGEEVIIIGRDSLTILVKKKK